MAGPWRSSGTRERREQDTGDVAPGHGSRPGLGSCVIDAGRPPCATRVRSGDAQKRGSACGRPRGRDTRISLDLRGSAHGPHLLAVSVRSAAKSHSGVSARSSRASADAGAPTILLGQAPRDRRPQRPSRLGRPIPSHVVSPVALPGSAEPCCCYMFCYTPKTSKALSLSGKGLDLRKLVAGGGFEPPTSGL